MESKTCVLCLQNCQEQNQKDGSTRFTGDVLLKLPCGHSTCEKCIRSFIKLREPVPCKICFEKTELKLGDILLIGQDKDYLYEIFPALGGQILQPMNTQMEVQAHEMTDADLAAATSAVKLCGPEDLGEVDTPPSPEPITPQLPTGSQQLVHVSHIINPNSFFVHRACDNKLFHEILTEYQDSATAPKPNASTIAEGSIYLAFSKIKRMWLRCRAIIVEEETAYIMAYFIDVGITEMVTFDDVRLLSRSKWNKAPPLALHCSLANCDPIHGEWAIADRVLFEKILDSEKVVIYVQAVVETEEDLKFHCHVTTYELRVSVAHAFVFQGRAYMIVPNLPYPTIKWNTNRPQIVTSDFKMDSVEDVFLTHIVSPDKFFVRKIQNQGAYNRLYKELNEVYKSDVDSQQIFLPEIGMVYVVNTKEVCNKRDNYRVQLIDVTWARCVMTRMAPGGDVVVHLVDLGMYLMVHWNSLRAIKPRFLRPKALATECHLAGVTTRRNFYSWSQHSVAFFKNFQKQVLRMRVENKRETGSFGVCLFYKSYGRNWCVNNNLVEHRYAVTSGAISFKAPEDKPTQQPTSNSASDEEDFEYENSYEPAWQTNEDFLDNERRMRWEVKILNYDSPQLIYLKFADQEAAFDEMSRDMQDYYARNSEIKGKHTWEVSEKCCSMSDQWKKWGRAVILELDESEATIFYVDFGTVETVENLTLKVLPPEFQLLHFAAVKCHLQDVVPASGKEWPSVTKRFLKELLDAYKRVYVMKTGLIKDNSMPIEVWVCHTVQRDAFDAIKSEWRCLNTKLIEQGLAIPVASEQLDAAQMPEKKYHKLDEDFLSFNNAAGLFNEWLQLANKPGQAKAEVGNDSASTRSNKGWLPAERFKTTNFAAYPTFVNEAGIIYLHDVAQKETLVTISDALKQYFVPDPSPPHKEFWEIGERCVALRKHDSRFYRATVLEVNHKTSSCLVHYIDYGNEETCLFDNMRESIVLHEVPAQARKCTLGIVTQIGGAQWDRRAVDYIYKLTVGKKCIVRVLGSAIDGITPIELSLGELCVNYVLVTHEMAVYADSSDRESE